MAEAGADGELAGPSGGGVSPGGRVEVAEGVIAAIVHGAVLSCYGIVDMAPRPIRSAIGKRLGLTSRARGIAVHVADGRVSVELSVVMEYGTPIFTVARNVMKTVKFRVERTLGMPVERVNVNVEGLRVSPGAAPARGRS